MARYRQSAVIIFIEFRAETAPCDIKLPQSPMYVIFSMVLRQN